MGNYDYNPEAQLKIKPIFNCKFISIFGAEAMTMYPFILFQEDKNYYLEISYNTIVHEMTHVRQIRTLGFFTFYFRYLVEFFKNLLKGMTSFDAYRAISFEIEARKLEYGLLTEIDEAEFLS